MSIVVKSMLCAGAALGALGGVAQARQTVKFFGFHCCLFPELCAKWDQKLSQVRIHVKH